MQPAVPYICHVPPLTVCYSVTACRCCWVTVPSSACLGTLPPVPAGASSWPAECTGKGANFTCVGSCLPVNFTAGPDGLPKLTCGANGTWGNVNGSCVSGIRVFWCCVGIARTCNACYSTCDMLPCLRNALTSHAHRNLLLCTSCHCKRCVVEPLMTGVFLLAQPGLLCPAALCSRLPNATANSTGFPDTCRNRPSNYICTAGCVAGFTAGGSGPPSSRCSNGAYGRVTGSCVRGEC